MSDRQQIFIKELSFIKNENLKKSSIRFLDTLPDYFFKVPASSTGKYHPDYALGEGGLVRHTQAAVRIANELFNMEYICKIFNEHVRDLILVSLIFHDGWKHGIVFEQYTRFDHPRIAAKKILSSDLFGEEDKKIISSCIHSHMGHWNTNVYSEVVLPKPRTGAEKFVHHCDYLASRKFLEFNFKE